MQVSNLKSDQSNGLPAIKKIRGLIRCYHEHGLHYTADRLLTHLHITPERDYAFYSALPPEKYPRELKRWYRNTTGEKLNLKNPKTFNEKIQWLKLYDSTPLKTRLADKYLVRDWIKEQIGEEYLIPLLGVWDSFDEIDFDKLPNQFVLKANHGSGWNIIVKDKSTFDREEARKKFDVWMHTNFAFLNGFELQYSDIPPKIIAEKYIEQMDENLLDYKIHVFAGEPKIIQIIGNRNLTKHTAKEVFLNPDWEPQSLMYHTYDMYDTVPAKPDNLNEILEMARILGAGFRYVRVDLYDIEDKVLFGEMTFTPASGTGKWGADKAQYLVGSWIDAGNNRSRRLNG